ncbi:DUF4097 family beta strand repeat-containing protein [Shewanella surugensis]|uniref:DUF4097 family beta strand repeat-containing protein n=1 Tax=Shewanella surugensis TaxID=212020 RepID=A0ABT0L5I8_9GAMM|nr:DUF4097 family beta strand repeat-containing protein [Shewanella surugensis]MCL1122954.1 DUF4097 family beta strand repeat-containing protein [Shewanella surugensis]
MMRSTRMINFLLIPFLLFSQASFAAKSINKQMQLQGDVSLNVKVLRGKVLIQTWQKHAIKVTGSLDKFSEGFVFDKEGNKVVIEDKLPEKVTGENKYGSDLVITVPASLSLTVLGVSANYDVSQLGGELSIETVSGHIKADQLSGTILLHTISGDIITKGLQGDASLDTVSGAIADYDSQGTMRYSSVNGNLSANNQAKNVFVEQISGNTTLRLTTVDNLSVKSISGALELNLDSLTNSAHISSVSGDIFTQFSKMPSCNFDIDAGPGGKITNTLTKDKPSKEKYRPNTYLRFMTGEGAADFFVKSISGHIQIRKQRLIE